jgi:YVTN family beta-propeller protein
MTSAGSLLPLYVGAAFVVVLLFASPAVHPGDFSLPAPFSGLLVPGVVLTTTSHRLPDAPTSALRIDPAQRDGSTDKAPSHETVPRAEDQGVTQHACGRNGHRCTDSRTFGYPPLPSIPILGTPGSMTYDGRNGFVYVPITSSDEVTVVTGTQVVTTFNVQSGPDATAYDPRNGYVYIANLASDSVSILNGTTVVGTVYVGSIPQALVYDSGNGYVYVADFGGSVTVIDNTTSVASAAVGVGSSWLVYDNGDGFIYAVNSGAYTVSIINGTEVIQTLSMGTQHGNGYDYFSEGAYDSQDGYVYLPSYYYTRNVAVLSGTEVVGYVNVGNRPECVTYDPENGYVYVMNQYSANVSVISGLELIGTVDVGMTPVCGTYDSRDGDVYVANNDSGTVSVIKGTTLVATIGVGEGPQYPLFDSVNGFVYVANTYSDNLSVIGYSGYPVTFSETGLPPGTAWAVNISGRSTFFSRNATLSFEEGNGTYSYTISTANSSYSPPGRGTFSVNGSGVGDVIAFSPLTYSVAFSEAGLPSGTSWSVSLGGTIRGSNSTMISFMEQNGSYLYVLSPIPGFTSEPPSGVVSVHGSNLSQAVAFAQVTYVVTFEQTGLAMGANWSLTLGGVLRTSTSFFSIAFNELNGSYPYSVGQVAGYSSNPISGTIVIDGASQTVFVVFMPRPIPTYAVTFSELGLPSGESWSVTLNGTQTYSKTATVTFFEANGTYAFAIGINVGYTSSPGNGAVSVEGRGVDSGVSFTRIPAGGPPPLPTFLGLPAAEGYDVLGGIIAAAVVGVAIAVLVRRRRKAPPASAGGPAEPKAGDPPVSQ